MKQDVSTESPFPCSGIRLFFLHVVCFATVVCYVNMFQFWAWLSKQVGPGFLVKTLPVGVTLIVLLVVVSLFIRRVNRGHRIKFVFLGLGIVAAFFSLAIPDPHVPIKRIHVAEYIVLSFFVRYTLSHRLQGASLTLFTALVTILLGIHDEMLQGIHSLRYYGWRDIVVNGVAGLSGSLLGHGLMSFERHGASFSGMHQKKVATVGMVVLYLLLGAAALLLVVLMYQQRGDQFSCFALFPVAGVSLILARLYPEIVMNSQKHHGLQVVFWLTLGLLIYPLVVNLGGMEFI